LRGEQQGYYSARKSPDNEAYKKGAKLITLRHGNLLLVIKLFGILFVKIVSDFAQGSCIL
jgi:hypothetical protein